MDVLLLLPSVVTMHWHQTTLCLNKRTPKTFYYIFAKIALIWIKIGTRNLYNVIKLQYYKTFVYITLPQ